MLTCKENLAATAVALASTLSKELPENLVYDNLDRSLKYSQNAIKYIEAIIEEIVTQLLDGYPNKITERSIQRVLKSNYVLAKIFGEDYEAI